MPSQTIVPDRTSAVEQARRTVTEMRDVGRVPQPAPGISTVPPLGIEVGFILRSEGPCGLCSELIVGDLVAALIHLGEPTVPIFRCAPHRRLPLNARLGS